MDWGGDEDQGDLNDESGDIKSNFKIDDLIDENTNNQRSTLLDMFLNDDNDDSVSADSVLFISQKHDIDSLNPK